MIRTRHLVKPQTRNLRVWGFTVMLVCLGMNPLSTTYAEDEDTSSSVYLVFDPETGEFITQEGHETALPNQTGLEDSSMPASEADNVKPGVATAPGGLSPTLLLGIASLIVAGGGAFIFVWRRRGT